MAKSAKTNKKSSSILTPRSLEFLKNYINNPSPVGFESSGQKLWLEYLRPYVDSQFTDSYGTAVGVINPKAPFKVVIEAHADEISWFINYINPEGLLYLKRNGGVEPQAAASQTENVHDTKGPVKSVLGWPSIHTLMWNSPATKRTPQADIFFPSHGERQRERN